MRFVVTSVSDVVTTSLFDVVKALLQRHQNIKHLVSRPFYYGKFWFISRHRKVRELQKYLSIESSLWEARRTLVNPWLCLLLVCEQDKVARLGAKVAMKGLGRGKKCLQHSIVDLFPDIPTVPDRWSLHGEWTWNTHTHTKVLSGIKHSSFLSLFTFSYKYINWGHSFITSTKRREVTKIWAILQVFADNFRGGGVSFFYHM